MDTTNCDCLGDFKDIEKIKEKNKKDSESYKNFLKIRDDIYDKWKDSPYLQGFPEKHVKQVAMILDNEDKFIKDHDATIDDWFRKNGLELTQKVLKDCIIFDLVSVQPMLHPVATVFYTKFQYDKGSNPDSNLPEIYLRINEEEEITAKTRNIGARTYDNVDIDKLATEIREKITREVLIDLRNNAGTVAKRKINSGDEYYVYNNICEISGYIHRKTLRGRANWIVTGPDMIKELSWLGRTDKTEDVNTIKKIGTLCNAWRVYVDPLFTKNQILIGSYDPDQLYECYIYSPYILLVQAQVVINPETTDIEEHRNIHVKYCKKLLRAGSKYYGRITYEEEVLPKV